MAEGESKTFNLNTWIALTTALMAVLAAITTLYVGKYSSRTVLFQAQETDQWAYYQAKSIKSYLYEVQKQEYDIEMAARQSMTKAAREKMLKAMEDYDKQINRYDGEKKEIKARAEELAKGKEKSSHMAGNFGYALIFLQIAIMLSSIAALTKKPYLWYMGMATTSGWIFFFLDAFYLFY